MKPNVHILKNSITTSHFPEKADYKTIFVYLAVHLFTDILIELIHSIFVFYISILYTNIKTLHYRNIQLNNLHE